MSEGAEAAALRVRRLRALTLMDATAVRPLQTAISKRGADKADANEQGLADLYLSLECPPHVLPWWLGRDAHSAVLYQLRATEERLLLAPVYP